MGKDPSENRLEEKPDVFADVMNNLVLGGQKVITEEELVLMPTRAYVRKTDGELRSGMRDVRMESRKHGILHLISSFENQTEIDNTMPERVMGYEYSSYEEQVKQIMDENNRKKKYAGAKRIFRNQKLAPVLTGVLYYGRRKWKTPLRLHEMLQFPEGMEEELKPYVADYPINLVQVAHLTKEERERLTSDFRIVAEYLACRDDKEKWIEFLENTKEIRHVEELLDVIWELSGDENYRILREKIMKKEIRKEKWTMCEMIQSVIRAGREEGIKEGIETGRREGIETGRQSGIFAMIHENLDMGKEKESILEKLVKYFSITKESAEKYYNQVAMG